MTRPNSAKLCRVLLLCVLGSLLASGTAPAVLAEEPVKAGPAPQMLMEFSVVIEDDLFPSWAAQHFEELLNHANLYLNIGSVDQSKERLEFNALKGVSLRKRENTWSLAQETFPAQPTLYTEDGRELCRLTDGDPEKAGVQGGRIRVGLSEILPVWTHVVCYRTLDEAGNPGRALDEPIHQFKGFPGSTIVDTMGLTKYLYFADGVRIDVVDVQRSEHQKSFFTRTSNIDDLRENYTEAISEGIEWWVCQPTPNASFVPGQVESSSGALTILKDMVCTGTRATKLDIRWDMPEGQEYFSRLPTPDLNGILMGGQGMNDALHTNHTSRPSAAAMPDGKGVTFEVFGCRGLTCDARTLPDRGIETTLMRLWMEGEIGAVAEVPLLLEAGRLYTFSVRAQASTQIAGTWGNVRLSSRSTTMMLSADRETENPSPAQPIELMIEAPNITRIAPTLRGETCTKGHVLDIHVWGDPLHQWPGLWGTLPVQESCWKRHGELWASDAFPCLVWWYGEKARILVTDETSADGSPSNNAFWGIAEAGPGVTTHAPELSGQSRQNLRLILPALGELPAVARNGNYFLSLGGRLIRRPVTLAETRTETEIQVPQWRKGLGRPEVILQFVREGMAPDFSGAPPTLALTRPISISDWPSAEPVLLLPFSDAEFDHVHRFAPATYQLELGESCPVQATLPMRHEGGMVLPVEWQWAEGSLVGDAPVRPTTLLWGGQEIALLAGKTVKEGHYHLTLAHSPELAEIEIIGDLNGSDTLTLEWTEKGIPCLLSCPLTENPVKLPLPQHTELRASLSRGKDGLRALGQLNQPTWDGKLLKLKVTEEPAIRKTRVILKEIAACRDRLKTCRSHARIEVRGCASATRRGYDVRFSMSPGWSDLSTGDKAVLQTGSRYLVVELEIRFAKATHIIDLDGEDEVEVNLREMAEEFIRSGIFVAPFLHQSSFESFEAVDAGGDRFIIGVQNAKLVSVFRQSDRGSFTTNPDKAFGGGGLVQTTMRHLAKLPKLEIAEGEMFPFDVRPEVVPDTSVFSEGRLFAQELFGAETFTITLAPSEQAKVLDVCICFPDGSEMLRFPHDAFVWTPDAGRMHPKPETFERLRLMGLTTD